MEKNKIKKENNKEKELKNTEKKEENEYFNIEGSPEI